MANIIADMLTRIRNGQLRKSLSVSVPYSKFKESILKVIVKEGYIKSYDVTELPNNKREMQINLKYLSDGRAVIQEIKSVSKSGRRVYSSMSDLPSHYNGLGLVILSTSRGVMSDVDAKKIGTGGEIICTIF